MDDRLHGMSGTPADQDQARLHTLRRCEKLTGSPFSFMDILWQYNNPPNPSDAAIGPQTYDHHLYYRLVSVSLCVVRRIDDLPVALA